MKYFPFNKQYWYYYTHSTVTVLRKYMSPFIQDGVPIKLHGEMPAFKRNYCPEDAKPIIDKFLEVYFPLLDALDKDRALIEKLYDENACMTVTYKYSMRKYLLHSDFPAYYQAGLDLPYVFLGFSPGPRGFN